MSKITRDQALKVMNLREWTELSKNLQPLQKIKNVKVYDLDQLKDNLSVNLITKYEKKILAKKAKILKKLESIKTIEG